MFLCLCFYFDILQPKLWWRWRWLRCLAADKLHFWSLLAASCSDRFWYFCLFGGREGCKFRTHIQMGRSSVCLKWTSYATTLLFIADITVKSHLFTCANERKANFLFYQPIKWPTEYCLWQKNCHDSNTNLILRKFPPVSCSLTLAAWSFRFWSASVVPVESCSGRLVRTKLYSFNQCVLLFRLMHPVCFFLKHVELNYSNRIVLLK